MHELTYLHQKHLTFRSLAMFIRCKNAVFVTWEIWLSKDRLLSNITTRFLTVEEVTLYIYIYIYAFSRRFYPKRLTIAFRLYIFISTCVPWESNQCQATTASWNARVTCCLKQEPTRLYKDAPSSLPDATLSFRAPANALLGTKLF